ncbi:hypothetical protein [Brevibacillus sp. SIMBA_076]
MLLQWYETRGVKQMGCGRGFGFGNGGFLWIILIILLVASFWDD